jgi:hypothetical protein
MGRSLVPLEHLSVKDQRMLDRDDVIEIETHGSLTLFFPDEFT